MQKASEQVRAAIEADQASNWEEALRVRFGPLSAQKHAVSLRALQLYKVHRSVRGSCEAEAQIKPAEFARLLLAQSQGAGPLLEKADYAVLNHTHSVRRHTRLCPPKFS